jgi:hypothetical protein
LTRQETQEVSSWASFWEIVLFAALFGILLHAILLAHYVAKREHPPQRFTLWLIFFSGMWYIGPIVYLWFRQSRPLLARACLRQTVAVTGLWLFLVLLHYLEVGHGSGA